LKSDLIFWARLRLREAMRRKRVSVRDPPTKSRSPVSDSSSFCTSSSRISVSVACDHREPGCRVRVCVCACAVVSCRVCREEIQVGAPWTRTGHRCPCTG
jgi:hypothetical protein